MYYIERLLRRVNEQNKPLMRTHLVLQILGIAHAYKEDAVSCWIQVVVRVRREAWE